MDLGSGHPRVYGTIEFYGYGVLWKAYGRVREARGVFRGAAEWSMDTLEQSAGVAESSGKAAELSAALLEHSASPDHSGEVGEWSGRPAELSAVLPEHSAVIPDNSGEHRNCPGHWRSLPQSPGRSPRRFWKGPGQPRSDPEELGIQGLDPVRAGRGARIDRGGGVLLYSSGSSTNQRN